MATSRASSDLAAIIGSNIREARLAAGFTQRQLAVRANDVQVMAVSRWERGTHRPSDLNLVQLAEVLGRDVSWFYTDHRAEAAA